MAKSLMEKRDAVLKQAKALQVKANENADAFTDEDLAELKSINSELSGLNEKIKAARGAEDLLASLGGPVTDSERQKAHAVVARSLGENFIKTADLSNLKAGRGFRLSAEEFGVKAAGDVHTTLTTGAGLLQPQIDTNIVKGFRERPTIADWLGAGELTSTSIRYFVEKAFDPATGGNFDYVAEAAKKPGLTFPGYDEKTETLKKIAGWIKLADEMAEDMPFLVSEINNRLLYQLVMFEENALLNGDGVGQHVLGLFNRSGLQTETAADAADNADAIFRARTKVTTATGLQADGMVINPLDYQALRLTKDANGQYFAGGPFAGQYGNGSVLQDPPLWGMQNTIVTTAVPRGTALIGAGKTAATVYRKGGIQVTASNIDGEDMTHNRFTILAEERLTLAVRQPSAFVKITLGV